jgi:hypothetical protein
MKFTDVKSAGLVLLEPFIPQLFRHLGYTDGRGFVNDSTKVRAFSLLSTLSDAEANQHWLLMLICDLPIEGVQEVELNENELSELQKMLKAAISSWGSLRNISTESFVKYWIRREGVLLENEDSYSLEVKRETGDILLNFIKWNFRIIKFPWMSKPIEVKWRY